MFFYIRKSVLTLFILCLFQVSYALDICSLQGDFVPWPWSEPYYAQVLNQNWQIVDAQGNPHAEMVITKTSMFWGWGSDIYNIVERNKKGQTFKWGNSAHVQDEKTRDALSFNMWNEFSDPPTKQEYTVVLGYWRSAHGQITLEEEQNYTNAPLGPPFILGPGKVCRSFRHRADRVVGLVLTVETQVGDKVKTEVYYGLTEDPIYTLED